MTDPSKDPRFRKGVPIIENFELVCDEEILKVLNLFYSSGCFLDKFSDSKPQRAFFYLAMNKKNKQLVIVPNAYNDSLKWEWFRTVRGKPLDNYFHHAVSISSVDHVAGIDVYWIAHGWSVILYRKTPMSKEIIELIDKYGRKMELTSDALDYYNRIASFLTTSHIDERLVLPVQVYLWLQDRIKLLKLKYKFW